MTPIRYDAIGSNSLGIRFRWLSGLSVTALPKRSALAEENQNFG